MTNLPKYRNISAYCKIEYRCKEKCCNETVWCNGDLKIPTTIVNRRTRHPMEIVDPKGGMFTPHYEPKPGERVFVQATKEMVKQTVEKFVKDRWAVLKGKFLTEADAIRFYNKEWTATGMPWMVTIEPERKLLVLKTGEVMPFVCPVCRQHFPYDPIKVAHGSTITCTCGFSGTAKDFSEIEFEIQTWIN